MQSPDAKRAAGMLLHVIVIASDPSTLACASYAG